MTPDELKAGRAELRMTQKALSDFLGLSQWGERNIRKWEHGDHPIPGSVERAIRFALSLQKIATGSGVYGAQALEYKNIARVALGWSVL